MKSKKMKAFKEKCRENQEKIPEYQETPMMRKMNACQTFFQKLADILEEKYEIVGSCNKDQSQYLVPLGTADQISYYGKPAMSFRVSDHWNWYSSTKKCKDPDYVQCNSVDMPRAKRRTDEHATRPRRGVQVAIQWTDGYYHHVFGEKWDPKERRFVWVKSNPEEICRRFGLIGGETA